MNKTVEYETDNIPTSCHILVVDNDGNLLEQIKVRKARDYSPEYLLRKGCEHLNKLARCGTIFKNHKDEFLP